MMTSERRKTENIPKILLVDDDRIILKVLSKMIDETFNIPTVQINSLNDLQKIIKEDTYLLSICDYHLPDAEHGEAIDTLIKNRIPTIVLTASYDKNIKEKILEKDVIDYLVKGTPNIHEHIIYTISRTLKNINTKVLVIDDSRTDRILMKKILENMLFQVLEASSTTEAMNILKNNTDIKLIITDYYLPEENTVEFIHFIRKKFKKHEMGIIVVSGSSNSDIISVLLKAGANDFLNKPFSKEEFIIRVNNTIEILDTLKELEFYAYHDPLTGLYNRRYFFQKGPKLWLSSKKRGQKLACITIDIDNFKKINDTYGHSIGDEVLKDLSSFLKTFFTKENNLIARTGGEEFTLLIGYEREEELIEQLEILRKQIEKRHLKIQKNSKKIEINYTISIGVEFDFLESLEDMIISADHKLYESKKKGKNRITF